MGEYKKIVLSCKEKTKTYNNAGIYSNGYLYLLFEDFQFKKRDNKLGIKNTNSEMIIY